MIPTTQKDNRDTNEPRLTDRQQCVNLIMPFTTRGVSFFGHEHKHIDINTKPGQDCDLKLFATIRSNRSSVISGLVL